MLPYHQQDSVTFIWRQFQKEYLRQSQKLAYQLALVKKDIQISQGPMSWRLGRSHKSHYWSLGWHCFQSPTGHTSVVGEILIRKFPKNYLIDYTGQLQGCWPTSGFQCVPNLCCIKYNISNRIYRSCKIYINSSRPRDAYINIVSIILCTEAVKSMLTHWGRMTHI